ncbi:MAG: biotin--[acetyl-CoA-carboxylase] ligase [bacterium]|nr:biotin--[acetyl-CoA-carboxylase] ligase [bacterium]
MIKDPIKPFDITRGLKTNYIGKNIHYLKRTSSTNEEAKKLAKLHEAEGTLIIAEVQNKGKGRFNRHWFSPQGGIWASLILRPTISSKQIPLITLIVGIAICEAVREITKKEATLKWPNDCLIKGKKFSGILLESQKIKNVLEYLVVGFGVNVNINKELFPKDLENIATSLNEELGKKISRIDLIKLILENIEHLYEIIKKGGIEEIKRRWKYFSDTIGREVSVMTPKEIIKGRALDINDEGALIISQNHNKIITVYSGDLEYL